MELGPFTDDPDYRAAVDLDTASPLDGWAERFVIDEPDLIYLDGNSLGALPKATADRVKKVLDVEWGEHLVDGWLKDNWMGLSEVLGDKIAKLIGAGNVCGPTTSSLAGPFGLQPLIGKSLAIVSDARFHDENIATVVERLLCISGEDTLTVDRKNITSVTLKLPTRFMFLTNEFPRLSDSSGALAGRFIILRFTESFYGREDTGLTERLLGELPGILNWAVEGWQRQIGRAHV